MRFARQSRAAALFCIALTAITCAAAPIERPSVILISIDTLRADHLGIYGYKGSPTHQIDSYAEHGTVFTQVDSQIPLTLPSHTCLFTSNYPFQTHVEENAEIVPSNLVTLASVLRNNGYATGAFIGSALLSRRYGLDNGFDLYDSPFRAQTEQESDPYSLRVRRDGALVARSALNWIAAKQGRPVFAFVHLFDLHTPYAVRQFSGNRLLPNTPGYDAEIRYVDQVLGHFKDALIRSGRWQQSVVIVLADHGESLGDHGETSHGYFIYQSTVHVPLIIHWPESAARVPERVAEPAGLIDVAPTVLNFLHIPVPRSFVGVDLLRHAPLHVYSETLYAHDAFHWAALRSLRVNEVEYIDAPHPELYDLHSDPGERNNLLRGRVQQGQRLHEQLATLLSRYRNDQPNATLDTSPASTQALRSLGYVGGGARRDDSDSAPDPKDKLPEYQAYERALTALYTNEAAVAAARFREILVKDPKNTLARYYLGDAYVKLGRSQSAIDEWRLAVQHDHTYEPALVAIGDLYWAEGSQEKALGAFQQAVAIAPDDYGAEFKLGMAEEKLGRFEDAKRHIEAACKAAPEQSADCKQALNRTK